MKLHSAFVVGSVGTNGLMLFLLRLNFFPFLLSHTLPILLFHAFVYFLLARPESENWFAARSQIEQTGPIEHTEAAE